MKFEKALPVKQRWANAIFAKQKAIDAKSRRGIGHKVLVQKGALMKTTLLLADETTEARLLLQNDAPIELFMRKTDAVAGCNCDRWGHPCPGCTERNVPPKAELPVSGSQKQMR